MKEASHVGWLLARNLKITSRLLVHHQEVWSTVLTIHYNPALLKPPSAYIKPTEMPKSLISYLESYKSYL